MNHSTSFSDVEKDFLGKAMQGDTEAFFHIISLYKVMFMKVVFDILHDQTETEDIFWETTLEAWKKFDSFSSQKGTFYSWMITLYKRRAIDQARRRSSYSNCKERYACLSTGNRESHENLETILVRDLQEIFNKILEEKIRQPRYRTWARMHYLQGMSHNEIATHSSVAPGTVKSALLRTQYSLQVHLTEIGYSRN